MKMTLKVTGFESVGWIHVTQ